METIVVELKKDLFFDMLSEFSRVVQETEYTIKEVKIKDDFFKDDKYHSKLKELANQSYKMLKQYEFDKRNK